MMRSTIYLGVFALLCLSIPAAALQPAVPTPGSEMVAADQTLQGFGVSRYSVLRDARGVEVELYALDGNISGTIRISRNATVATGELNRPGLGTLRAAMDTENGALELTTWSGKTFRYIEQGGAWVGDERGPELLSANGDFELLGSFMSRYDEGAGARGSDDEVIRNEVEEVSFGQVEASQPTCGGSWFSGSGYSGSSAWAAFNAEQDVHHACWNSACIGCCQIIAPDCTCFFGGADGYFCCCFARGKACTR